MAKAKKAPIPKEEYVPTPEQKAFDKVQLPPLRVQKDGSITLEHPDPKTGLKLLFGALGTSDSTFAHGLLTHLKAVSEADGEISEGNLNFLLSIVRGVEPKDPLESMLAVQMAIIHQTMIEYRPYLVSLEHPSNRSDALAALNKLARTFAVQMDALKRYRSKGEQKMVVQHVNVSEGGQAIVGDIHQQQKEMVALQPPALTHSKEQPMEPLDERPKQTVTAKRKPAR